VKPPTQTSNGQLRADHQQHLAYCQAAVSWISCSPG
jgi:hypothetical protein